MLKMLNEALVLVINAYYEKELKVIGLASEKWSNQKGSDGDSYVAKYIRKIKFNLQLSNCEEDNIAGHIRRDFTKVRNLIAHDIEGDILAQVRKSVDSPPGMLTEDHHHTVHEERHEDSLRTG